MDKTSVQDQTFWRCEACRMAGMWHCSEVENCIEHGQMRQISEHTPKEPPHAG